MEEIRIKSTLTRSWNYKHSLKDFRSMTNNKHKIAGGSDYTNYKKYIALLPQNTKKK